MRAPQLRGARSQTTQLKNEPKATRAFEDSILDMVALDQVLCEMRADMALSVILQMFGYSQREIAAVGGRNQQGIGYHVDLVKRAMERG